MQSIRTMSACLLLLATTSVAVPSTLLYSGVEAKAQSIALETDSALQPEAETDSTPQSAPEVDSAPQSAPETGSTPQSAPLTFPIQGTNEKTVWKNKGHMKTSFDLDSNGNLNATTKTWNDSKFAGFTGGVTIAFTDTSGTPIWSTKEQRYGVDGKAIGNSNRTENWQATVPPEILSRIGGYAIVQQHTPQGRAIDWFGSEQGQQVIKQALVLIRGK